MKMFIFAAVVTLAAMSVPAFAQSKGIEGVWSLTEITTTGEDGKTQPMTQPSMYLFTKKHYSIIYVNSDKPRPDMSGDELGKATADQIIKVYVDSFIANAGTYELQNGKLTLHPMVAKAPGYMKSGNWSTLSVKADANSMTLVSDTSSVVQTKNPTTFKLKRVE